MENKSGSSYRSGVAASMRTPTRSPFTPKVASADNSSNASQTPSEDSSSIKRDLRDLFNTPKGNSSPISRTPRTADRAGSAHKTPDCVSPESQLIERDLDGLKIVDSAKVKRAIKQVRPVSSFRSRRKGKSMGGGKYHTLKPSSSSTIAIKTLLAEFQKLEKTIHEKDEDIKISAELGSALCDKSSEMEGYIDMMHAENERLLSEKDAHIQYLESKVKRSQKNYGDLRKEYRETVVQLKEAQAHIPEEGDMHFVVDVCNVLVIS